MFGLMKEGGMFGGLFKKMMPKIAESVNSHELDLEKGEFQNCLMIKFPEEGNPEIYKCTVAKKEGSEYPMITRLVEFEMDGGQ